MSNLCMISLYIPTATYRFQFNSSFTFRDATALVPYLYDLGISDCYASPILKARPGSVHGYDICDHSQLNPELGSTEEFDTLVEALHTHGMGLIFDMVPNHMGIGTACNTWWMDVLENGPSSIYAGYFDIDWSPVKPELKNKVLLPILGDQYGNVLEQGQLRLAYEDGAFWLHYYEHILPIAPKTYSSILGYELDNLIASLGSDNEHVHELQSILTAISYLPSREERDQERILERNREKEIIKRRIATLYHTNPEIHAAVDSTVERFNGTVGDSRSFDLLDDLINEQAYRLSFWRVATEEINYRRFFDINDLAAIRVELPEVFRATHQLMFELLARGKIGGLRIDHPEGLWDPPGYFLQLQVGFLAAKIRAESAPEVDQSIADDSDPEVIEQESREWLLSHLKNHEGSVASLPLYVVAEKILSPSEHIPKAWTVAGTTGYDFLNMLNGVFVQTSNEEAISQIYQHFTGHKDEFHDLVHATKRNIIDHSLVSEINEISYQLERIAERNRKYRDFTLNGITSAMREVIASLPVYRTYVTDAAMHSGYGQEPGGKASRQFTVDNQDRRHVRTAVKEAQQRNRRTPQALFDFIQDTLLLRNLETFREEERERLIDFVMRVQQLTGPVMAKGLEDTAFYRYNRLVSLNEVGGHPERFGVALDEFHQKNTERYQHWPHSMLTTSTHDTKRSEDVRARINVLSEIPEEWEAALIRWRDLNTAITSQADGRSVPEEGDEEAASDPRESEPVLDPNDEYLFYQTLVGVWHEERPGMPEFAQFRERIAEYMSKSTKEAKLHTSWINPNEAYDTAVRNFVVRALPDDGNNPFLQDFMPFQQRVSFYGQFNALSQVLLKLTSPGIPDTYQGTELWDLSLVDPDNRRPVDYQLRNWLLSGLRRRVSQPGQDLLLLVQELLDSSHDGRIKLYLVYCTLNFRREHSALFRCGDYIPLEAIGEKQDHLCAFARTMVAESDGATSQEILVIAPRLIVGLTDGVEQPPLGAKVWKDTVLLLPHAHTGQSYRNLFTGEILTVRDLQGRCGLLMADVCAHFPVALLSIA